MRSFRLGFLFVMLAFAWSMADMTIHIQSPYKDDPVKGNESVYGFHITGGTTIYGHDWKDEGSVTRMTAEGDHWYSFTWKGTLADYLYKEGFDVDFCEDTARVNTYNNHCETWNKFSLNDFFKIESEVYLYTDGTKYSVSMVPPGSKFVWFKSPWGNRSLPQLILGQDSILMRAASGDAAHCGWFYGAISGAALKRNPALTGHFMRFHSPYMTFPENGSVDLSAALIVDTIYVDGTTPAAEYTAGDKMGSVGTCFDSTKTLHVYHPWRSNSTYRDSAVLLDFPLFLPEDSAKSGKLPMYNDGEYPRWWRFDFKEKYTSMEKWNDDGTRINIHRQMNAWPPITLFSDGEKPRMKDLFPAGVYEAWIFTSTRATATEISFSPLEPKTVRLLSPWDDMSPSMLVDGDTVKMGPIGGDTCGWYQGTYFKHAESWKVLFKQTFGMAYYSADGTSEDASGVGEPIDLDTMMSIFDTSWVYPYPVSNSPPQITYAYPKKLGRCPTMTVSAMLLDWAGESFADSIDVDFGGIYNGNQYTAVYEKNKNGQLDTIKSCGGLVKGMVLDTLVNGLPVRVDSSIYPWALCPAAREVDKWFIPQVVAKDAAGKEYTNATCRDINLTLDEEGFWLADVSESSPDGGFFPVDDFKFLDSAKTIPNPKFDHEVGDNGQPHNYSFSMKISAQFNYVPGQYFEFRGDDDVWVFINNKLVVDIGGCHSPEEGFVDLDTLGLIEGKEYPFHIFFSERNKTGSNFKMRTSINLRTERTFFPREKATDDGTISYEILQILTKEALTCDISSVADVDTTLAQSLFVLSGGNLPAAGQVLDPGVNFGGIVIAEDMTSFTIDTTLIMRSRSLAPGTYCLIVSLASDPSQSMPIFFEVPAYPLPSIAFVDSLGEVLDPTNLNLLGVPMFLPEDHGANDTLLAFVAYPVRVAVLYYGAVCVDCIVWLNLDSQDSISFLDMSGNPITRIESDSTGFAKFYVMGLDDMTNASFVVGGDAVDNTLEWKNINFQKPPVPYATLAEMYDRDGNGVPDSLRVKFNEVFDEDYPDSLIWTFGKTTDSAFYSAQTRAGVNMLMDGDSIIVTGDSLIDYLFTGSSDKAAYKGSLRYHYLYKDEKSDSLVSLSLHSMINDRVGPVVLSAFVKPSANNSNMISVQMSESTDGSGIPTADLFELRVWRLGEESSYKLRPLDTRTSESTGSKTSLYYVIEDEVTGVLPSVGDSLRFVPGGMPDMSKNVPHVDNPWVRIIGEQRLETEIEKMVVLSAGSPTLDKGIAALLVPGESSIKDAMSQYGLLGPFIKYDLDKLADMFMDVPDSLIRIQWEVNYFTNLGQFVNGARGTVACSDKSVFKGSCHENPGRIFLGWDGRSEAGRMVGTGAYIVKVNWKVLAGKDKVGRTEETYTIGVRRVN